MNFSAISLNLSEKNKAVIRAFVSITLEELEIKREEFKERFRAAKNHPTLEQEEKENRMNRLGGIISGLFRAKEVVEEVEARILHNLPPKDR